MKWRKEDDMWIGGERYWIDYVDNVFYAAQFNEGVMTASAEHKTLKQAKAWSERKERKRVLPPFVRKAVCISSPNGVDTGKEYVIETSIHKGKIIDRVTGVKRG